MITISHPYVEDEGGETFLKARVCDLQSGREYLLWYSVAGEYGRFLCDEVADGFVVCMLQAAMLTRQALKVEAPVSSRLLYNLYNTVMPLLCKVIPGSAVVEIEALKVTDIVFGGSGVGCGCSLGVDSFTSFLKHTGPDVPEDFRLTHLVLTRPTHYGDRNLDRARAAFRADAAYLQPFSDETGLPLVAVDSNIDEPYLDYDVPELQREIQVNLSCILCLQKLFGKYVFASSFPATRFKLTPDDVSYSESVLVPALGTQSTQLILSDPMMTRVQKTDYVAGSPLARRWLDVCIATALENGRWQSDKFHGRGARNCGKCPKCLRTLLTFEILGGLEDFSQLFDIDAYRRYRNIYITYVICCHRQNCYEDEIYSLMKERRFRIPSSVKFYCLGVKTGIYPLYKKLFRRGLLPQ